MNGCCLSVTQKAWTEISAFNVDLVSGGEEEHKECDNTPIEVDDQDMKPPAKLKGCSKIKAERSMTALPRHLWSCRGFCFVTPFMDLSTLRVRLKSKPTATPQVAKRLDNLCPQKSQSNLTCNENNGQKTRER
jgi:hypothetical protein